MAKRANITKKKKEKKRWGWYEKRGIVNSGQVFTDIISLPISPPSKKQQQQQQRVRKFEKAEKSTGMPWVKVEYIQNCFLFFIYIFNLSKCSDLSIYIEVCS